MRHTPHFLLTERDEIRRLIRDNPWVTIVSSTATGLVASHYPFLLDEEASTGDEVVVVSHVGRPDERLHELGEHEVMLIVQGPHGYVSPAWYPEGQNVPTWNHITAHLWGRPEILDFDENYRVLEHLTDHFEQHVEGGRSLDLDEEGARRLSKGTVGIRIRIDRVDARAKLSQNKPAEVRERVIAELEGDGPYAQPALAAEMRRRVELDAAAVAADPATPTDGAHTPATTPTETAE
ncbi:FMN-binding negative transcriptional regulator [Schumannella luteola]|uniref:Transcriptional regulator n=1 Tax=Schumannella luteola TaxID=472059 RepID=A0A852YGJ6_9MICO|nr:FMN-binding negative transcriptional regulator [Schumannella luteola]NYH00435.1 transcriptional regulator [Schumannella luteola]TPX03653.1 FMN-binding negative transcriptional regulator [Schumannella luteola]